MPEKFYNSSWNPDMYKKCIKHISFAVNMNLAKKVSQTQIKILENIILVLDNFEETIKSNWDIIEVIALEELKDITYD